MIVFRLLRMVLDASAPLLGDALAGVAALVVAQAVEIQLASAPVPVPVHCDVCNITRERISVDEVRALVVDSELPCCPGGGQVLIDPAAVPEAMAKAVAA